MFLLIAASLLRLGFVANFISAPVLTGFKAGIGLVIVLDQIPKILGIHFAKDGFFRDVASLLRHLTEASGATVAIGLAALILLLAMERLRPHSPAPLAIVAGGIAASWLLGLAAMGVGTVGQIPQALPSLTMPDAALVMQLLPGAAGIALMSFTESIAAARAFARPGEPRLRPNRGFWRQARPTPRAPSSAPCRRVAARPRPPSCAPSEGGPSGHPSSPRRPPWRPCSSSPRSSGSCLRPCSPPS